MDKHLIFIMGKSATGKSTTICRFFNLLIKEQFINAEPVTKDFYKVIDCNGKKVGFCSYGDPDSPLFKALPHFAREECFIILCACRTQGQTLTAVREIAKTHHYNMYPIYSFHEDNEADIAINNERVLMGVKEKFFKFICD